MTNEEAFKQWRMDYESDYDKKPSYLEVWQAAIAYMQEQNKSAEQSEPVATIYNGNAYWIGKEPPEGTNLFTTPQRVEASSTGVATRPLKRLDENETRRVLATIYPAQPHEVYDIDVEAANAIMYAMQELNK